MKMLPAVFLGLFVMAAGHAASPDQMFYMQAAEGGMAEVEAGKMAQDKGSSKAVRDFAAMMVKDHSKANDKLKKIATDKGVKLPTELNAEHQAMKKKLQSLEGAAFDKAYIEGQIKDHKMTVALMEREIGSGQDPDAKAFAQETLPVVKAHLDLIQRISKGDTNATSDMKH